MRMHYPSRSACYLEVVAEVTPRRSLHPEDPDPTDPLPDETENRYDRYVEPRAFESLRC